MTEDYPEHEKLRSLNGTNQVIGEFIDWLEDEKDIWLCSPDGPSSFWPCHTPIQDLMAEFFDIDQDKLEEEKLAMLELLRSKN
jgi:hypothetical protein